MALETKCCSIKPVELPMWHLAWCFSKASMVHIPAMPLPCQTHRHGTIPGQHASWVGHHHWNTWWHLQVEFGYLWKILQHWRFIFAALLAHKRCHGCNLLGSGFLSLTKWATAGNTLGSFKLQISLARSCSKRGVSKLCVLRSLLAKEAMVLRFLSHVKQDVKCPNLAWLSRKSNANAIS